MSAEQRTTTHPILVQEQHVPGRDVEEKFGVARSWGFDGLELRGQGDYALEARLPELRRAYANGVLMPTVCVEMSHFVGAFDRDLAEDAVRQMTSQLTVMAELGGVGAMTPASYGMFSRRLPPFEPPRSPEDDTAQLVDAFGRLAEHAASVGTRILLEPLNRYEDHMVNTIAQGVALCREVGNDAFRLAPDTYHMNIEEADPARSLADAVEYVAHVQASDSNRLEPGAGHVDWALEMSTLRSSGYVGPVAVESRLSGPAEVVLPRVPSLLRRHLA
ncbi:sugar phosphate isomerase/epimerase family protein [Cellulomonas sp. PhB143]|uniref:sugar phosphate isomerase/epimerase family protein n=1 Tax=Cellulomonas sp. PhB143 TaxID=2485186 RepID=UPI000F47E765|nr:sugar phosphate isomerase/epimerase family protein [Cellulomonas sp. PhB143]ROS75474.1 sugar phosphate isomerase/epimerase [Cellulomonas sp. PhB143]